MIIAQISDTHILARGADHPGAAGRAENLRRCVAEINRQAPDAVVHTGDSVQHGQPEEYDHLCEILSALEAPLTNIPGNRDNRGALRAAFNGHADLPRNGAFLHYAVEDHPLRLVALDSIAAGARTGARKGEFCAARRAWLDETLSRAPETPTVLLIHHPPFDVDEHYRGGYRLAEEAEALATVVRRHPQVARMLCGHVHCAKQVDWAGTRASIMPSVAPDLRIQTQPGPAARAPVYQLHAMAENGGLTSRTHFVTA